MEQGGGAAVLSQLHKNGTKSRAQGQHLSQLTWARERGASWASVARTRRVSVADSEAVRSRYRRSVPDPA
eukprot:1748155-Rhodomonas_salina.1